MVSRTSQVLFRLLIQPRNYIYDAKYGEKNGDKYSRMATPDTIEEIGKTVHQAVGSLRKRFTRGLRGLGRRKSEASKDRLDIQLTRR